MTQNFEAIVTASLPRQIAERIRESIVAGRLKVADRLPTEDELAQRFGVSRPTIREALKRLAAENLIHSRRGSTGGTFVKLPNPEEVGEALATSVRVLAGVGQFTLDDIIEARFGLGSLCCELAAQRGTEEDFDLMQAEITAQRDASLSDVEFCGSDVRFHHRLVLAAHNSVLSFLLPAWTAAVEPVTNLIVYRFRDRAIIADQHERIVHALRARTPKAAIEALANQCEYLRTKLGEAHTWRTAKADTVERLARSNL